MLTNFIFIEGIELVLTLSYEHDQNCFVVISVIDVTDESM